MAARLDALQPEPPWRLVGSAAIDWVTLMRPLDTADALPPGVRPWLRAAAGIDLDALAAAAPVHELPRAALRDHLLALYPAGSFVATDRLRLAAAEMDDDEWRFAWALQRVVSRNLEPAPARLCVLLALDAGADGPRRLSFGFGPTRAAGAPRPGEAAASTLWLELR